ncbi:MAG: hypothetical protein NZ839_05000 [Endomicrobia bacterium]|nr:hypothetical protein [Endomicrobiia bacterium]MCX7715831.1 hypothetical protein [Endomicrobiia bacterium]
MEIKSIIKFKLQLNNYLIILLFLILFLLFSCSTKTPNTYSYFSTIIVDQKNRTIQFETMPNLCSNEKYFLFYFSGYPWLKQHCLFVSTSSLRELQNAVAFIDWKLWEKIYMEKFSPKLKIEFYLENIGWTSIESIIFLFNFDTYQTIFWGSPLYDDIVLEKNYQTLICNNCELLPMEKNIILSGKKILNFKLLKPLTKRTLKVKIKFL